MVNLQMQSRTIAIAVPKVTFRNTKVVAAVLDSIIGTQGPGVLHWDVCLTDCLCKLWELVTWGIKWPLSFKALISTYSS